MDERIGLLAARRDLSDPKLGLLIRSEDQTPSTIFIFLNTRLLLRLVVSRLAFSQLSLHNRVKEAKVEVDILVCDIALCQGAPLNQVLAKVWKRGGVLDEEAVVHGPLLHFQIPAVQEV